MSEKLLLLPSAKSAVLIKQKKSHVLLRGILGVLGLFIVLYGAADIFSRMAHASFGADANAVAFGSAGVASFVPLTSTTPITPARLTISSIGVDAKVESVGDDASGAMKTPSTFASVAWYDLGAKPGEAGNAVIAGHVNNALTKAGVFEHLAEVKVGDRIQVADTAGRELVFIVRDIEDYGTSDAPADVIFAKSGKPGLVLITCAGDWDPKARSYDKRLVIFSDLAQ